MNGANLLDHRFTGRKLDTTEVTAAMNYLRELDPTSMPRVTNFLAKEPPYTEYLFETSYTEVKPTV